MKLNKLYFISLLLLISRSSSAGILIYSTEPIVIKSGYIKVQDSEVDLDLKFFDRFETPLIEELEDGQDRIVIASEKSLVIASGCSIEANSDILISANTNKTEQIQEVVLHTTTSHFKVKGRLSIHSKGDIKNTDNISVDPNNGSVAIAGKLISSKNIHIKKIFMSDLTGK